MHLICKVTYKGSSRPQQLLFGLTCSSVDVAIVGQTNSAWLVKIVSLVETRVMEALGFTHLHGCIYRMSLYGDHNRHIQGNSSPSQAYTELLFEHYCSVAYVATDLTIYSHLLNV